HYQFNHQRSLNFFSTFLFSIFQKKQMAMLNAKKLIKMDRKWQKFAAMQRKRISFPRNSSDADCWSTSSSFIAEKGHFVVYTTDQARFFIPLAYLENEVKHDRRRVWVAKWWPYYITL
ncbi:hypothetical protein AABB24_028340, partial [Solanum stoloniferum]